MIKNRTPKLLMKLQLIAAVIVMSSCSRQLAMVHSTNQHLAIVQAIGSHHAAATIKPEANTLAVAAPEVVLPEIKQAVPQGEPAGLAKMNILQKKIAKMAVAKVGMKTMLNPKVVTKSNATEQGAYFENHMLRVALVLILVGLLISAFGWPFYAVGSLFVIIGLIFLLLWALEM